MERKEKQREDIRGFYRMLCEKSFLFASIADKKSEVRRLDTGKKRCYINPIQTKLKACEFDLVPPDNVIAPFVANQ